MSLALFRQHSKLELLKPADTRFAFSFVMMSRLLECKSALEKLVVSDEWAEFAGGARVRDASLDCRDTILSSRFWKNCDSIVTLLEPAVCLMRMADGDTPCTGKMYYKCFEVGQHLRGSKVDGLSAAQHAQIYQMFKDRWIMLHNDLHAAGYALDPEYQEHDFAGCNAEVMEGLFAAIDKQLPDPASAALAIEQHNRYINKEGIFGRPPTMLAAQSMPAYKWWQTFGIGVPELRLVAMRVLSQVVSACSCERNWSTFDFIHNRRRNRLNSDKANGLVFIFSNLRLADKVADVQYEEDSIAWDVDSGSEEGE
jgi:hAT family C-terminal dimerisation region